MINAVLFDLDGTLLDTAHDIVGALNIVREEDNLAPIPFDIMRNHVSQGAQAMVSYAYKCDINSEYCQTRFKKVVEYYAQNIADHTVLFDGMDTLLNQLEQHEIKWGVVTNKPAFLTEPLMRLLGFDKRTPCIVSGDTLAVKKPDPEPVFYACNLLQCQPQESVFIGDDERDIIAGRNAGCRTIAANYGYILDHDNPINWKADFNVNHVHEIWQWIKRQNSR